MLESSFKQEIILISLFSAICPPCETSYTKWVVNFTFNAGKVKTIYK